jgi:DNA-binding MarR family transcriptional regulator
MLSSTTIEVKLCLAMKNSRNATMKAKSRKPRAPGLALGQNERHLGYFLRRLQIWVFQDFIETLGPMKIRPAQYSVLLVIEANPGRSQAAVGMKLGIERARLARMLHDLQRRKWVERANGSDARSNSLHLTAEGTKALTRLKRLAEQHEEKLIERVGRGRHKLMMRWLREFG